MRWLGTDEIIAFLNLRNYDVRVTGNARWIDQKCTPDVIWSIADFVLDFIDYVKPEFTVKDIWQSEYAKRTIAETYSKPNTDEETAIREYDKVFSQPLNMFCYAGIIKDISPSKKHIYVVKHRDILEYIARNDMFALRFLHLYIEKVLKDSELYQVFQNFFDNQDKVHFELVKQAFIRFYHEYTPIMKDYEPKRIFAKVLNPLAFKNVKKGTASGYMSKDVIRKADMMYNRDNFRDLYLEKPKGVPRQEWLKLRPQVDRRAGYFEQMMSRVKKTLRSFIIKNQDGLSELTLFIEGHDDNAPATQMHHIFPKSDFPEIMHYIENLIALTPNQHFGFAHPINNTQIIDISAQQILLVAKTYSIRQNLTIDEEPIYEFSNFLMVLSIGFDDKNALEIAENDYADVLHYINCRYEAI